MEGVPFIYKPSGVEFAREDEAGPSRTTGAPESPMFTATRPSPRKGWKDGLQ
jgi:hypothetical protein